MITYSIKEANDDIKQAVILKSGHEIEFTLGDVEYNQAQLLKSKKEVTATLNHHSIIVENVLKFNDFIKDLTDEQIHAVHMYHQSKTITKTCEDKLAEIDKVIVDGATEIAEVKRQLGIDDFELSDDENQTHEE